MGFYSRLGVCPSFDAAHKFVTSPFIRSPVALALVRLTAALYTVLVLLIALIWKTVKLDEGNRRVFPSSITVSSSLANQTPCFIIIASSPSLPTWLILAYAPITVPQVLKHSFTPLDGEN
jgi:hypothetical protein